MTWRAHEPKLSNYFSNVLVGCTNVLNVSLYPRVPCCPTDLMAYSNRTWHYFFFRKSLFAYFQLGYPVSSSKESSRAQKKKNSFVTTEMTDDRFSKKIIRGRNMAAQKSEEENSVAFVKLFIMQTHISMLANERLKVSHWSHAVSMLLVFV